MRSPPPVARRRRPENAPRGRCDAASRERAAPRAPRSRARARRRTRPAGGLDRSSCELVRRREAEAHAAHRVQVPRVDRVVAELARAGWTTCTSSVLVEPNQFVSQTSSITRSRVTTVPALRTSRASRSNSRRVSAISAPSSVARRIAVSTVMPPTWSGGSAAAGGGAPGGGSSSGMRRSTARIRATSSRAENGLTT